jgi:hypothetical protein
MKSKRQPIPRESPEVRVRMIQNCGHSKLSVWSPARKLWHCPIWSKRYEDDGTIGTGGLSALEAAFKSLGWSDPYTPPKAEKAE